MYVGMGTSVLDAAKYGIPSIPIAYSTYETIAQQYFFQDPTKLMGEKTEINNFDKLAKQIIHYSKDEYFNHAIQERKCVFDYYSVKTETDAIVGCFNNISYNSYSIRAFILNFLFRISKKQERKK